MPRPRRRSAASSKPQPTKLVRGRGRPRKKPVQPQARAASPVASIASAASSAVPIPPASVHRASLGSISSAIAAGGIDTVEAATLTPVKGGAGELCHTPKPEQTPGKKEVRPEINASVKTKEPSSPADNKVEGESGENSNVNGSSATSVDKGTENNNDCSMADTAVNTQEPTTPQALFHSEDEKLRLAKIMARKGKGVHDDADVTAQEDDPSLAVAAVAALNLDHLDSPVKLLRGTVSNNNNNNNNNSNKNSEVEQDNNNKNLTSAAEQGLTEAKQPQSNININQAKGIMATPPANTMVSVAETVVKDAAARILELMGKNDSEEEETDNDDFSSSAGYGHDDSDDDDNKYGYSQSNALSGIGSVDDKEAYTVGRGHHTAGVVGTMLAGVNDNAIHHQHFSLPGLKTNQALDSASMIGNENEFLNQEGPTMPSEEGMATPSVQQTPTKGQQLPNSSWAPSFHSLNGPTSPMQYSDYGQRQAQLTPATLNSINLEMGSISDFYQNTPRSLALERELAAVLEGKDGMNVAGSHTDSMAVQEKDGPAVSQGEILGSESQDCADEKNSKHASSIQPRSTQKAKLSRSPGKKSSKFLQNVKMPSISSPCSGIVAPESKGAKSASLSKKARRQHPGASATSKARSASSGPSTSAALERVDPGPAGELKIDAETLRVVSSPAHSTWTDASKNAKKKKTAILTASPETQQLGSKMQPEKSTLKLPKAKLSLVKTPAVASSSAKSKRRSPASSSAMNRKTVFQAEASISSAGGALPAKNTTTDSGAKSLHMQSKRVTRGGSVAMSLRNKHKRQLPKKIVLLGDSSSIESAKKPEAPAREESLQPPQKKSCDDSKASKPVAGRDASCTIVSDPTHVGSSVKPSNNAIATDSVSSDENAALPSASSHGEGSRDRCNAKSLDEGKDVSKVSPEIGASVVNGDDRYNEAPPLPAANCEVFSNDPSAGNTERVTASDHVINPEKSDNATNKQSSSKPPVTGDAPSVHSISSAQPENPTWKRLSSGMRGDQPEKPNLKTLSPAVNETAQITAPSVKDAGILPTTLVEGRSVTCNPMLASAEGTPSDKAGHAETHSAKGDDSNIELCITDIADKSDLSRPVNLLLDLFPPMQESPRNISETLQLVNVCHPKPDTYPYAYYARVLGFEIPRLCPGSLDEAGNIVREGAHWDKSLPEDEAIQAVPAPGKVFPMWRELEARLRTSQETNEQDGEYDSPLYKTILLEGWDDLCFLHPPSASKAFEGYTQLCNPEFIEQCTDQAREYKLQVESWAFDYLFPGEDDLCNDWMVSASEQGGERGLDLHYSLLSYNSSPVPEIVLGINNDFDLGNLPETGSKDPSLEAALVLVYALALEHGRACGARYCFLEVNPSISEFLQSRFRMDSVPSMQECLDEESKSSRLVCDLERCSTKYALLKQMESNVASAPFVSHKERLLVSISPTDASRARRIAAKKMLESPRDKGLEYSGAVGKKLRKIFVGLRVLKKATYNQSNLEMHFISQAGTKREEDGDVIASDLDMGSPLANWQILKAFPIPDDNPNDEQQFSKSQDSVLEYLKSKQEELAILESVLHPKACSLMDRVADERFQYERDAGKREKTRRTMEEYQERFSGKDVGRTWKQYEDDMECVCCICNDGEVTPHNRIVFCADCEVAMHQKCYGIVDIPYGHYYCRKCEHRRENAANAEGSGDRTGDSAPTVCQLCPRPGGAFKRIDALSIVPEVEPLWVHVACANWQGLKLSSGDVYADTDAVIKKCRTLGLKCCLCESSRGAFTRCQQQGCQQYMHLMCARDSGLCTVIDKATVGNTEDNIESELFCPEHSNIIPEDLHLEPVPRAALVHDAQRFPPEPVPFPRLPMEEQIEKLSQPNYEENFLRELASVKPDTRCNVCDEDYGQLVMRCSNCNAGICTVCPDPFDNTKKTGADMLCAACSHVASKSANGEECETPSCALCVSPGGWIRQASAKPRGKNKPENFAETLFAKDLWCHVICSRTLLDAEIQGAYDGCVDLTKKILRDGKHFRSPKDRCHLCGRREGLKKKCHACKKTGCYFHPTCARQAGFEVKSTNLYGKSFRVACLEHSSTDHNLRARIENMVVEEEHRKNTAESPSLSYAHCEKFLGFAVQILRALGWAWRWEEWWIKHNYRWEAYLPYLDEEQGKKADDYTDEEKRVFESTIASRRSDSRDCRLADFSAALRNRSYDLPGGGCDNVSLIRALRAVLDKPSIVGPLKDFEKDFLMLWLPMAYRSKSKNLCFGENKVEIGDADFCYVGSQRSPKFKLGDRPLPGKPGLEYASELFSSPAAAPRAVRAITEKTKEMVSPGSKDDVVSDDRLHARKDETKEKSKKRKKKSGETSAAGPPVANNDQQGGLRKKKARRVVTKGSLRVTSSPIAQGLYDKVESTGEGNSNAKKQSSDMSQSSRKRLFHDRVEDTDEKSGDIGDDDDDDDAVTVLSPVSKKSFRSRISNLDAARPKAEARKPSQGVKFAAVVKNSSAASVVSRASQARNSVSSRRLRKQPPTRESKFNGQEGQRPPKKTKFSKQRSMIPSSRGLDDQPVRVYGTKDNPINENELDDGNERDGVIEDMDELLITGGPIIAIPDDQISLLTCKTTGSGRTHVSKKMVHFSERSVEDDKKLDDALQQDKLTPFEVTREARCAPSPTSDGENITLKHNLIMLPKSQLRQRCVLCCKTCNDRGNRSHKRTGYRTRMGCRECYLQAFEKHYDVKIDRHEVPKQVKERAVYLCLDPRSGDESCFELWHASGPLPDLLCQVVGTPRSRNKLQKGQK